MKIFLLFLLIALLSAGALALYLTHRNPAAESGAHTARQMSEVWADFPFQSHYIEVAGSRMHYIDEGDRDGQVFLFLHGNPTSSYLWRKVVPVVAEQGRAIAVDNIGFGASAKPDIDYTFAEHARYLEAFIDALGLEDVILVIHDWGSALGFDYAHRHPQQVKGIVFMESILGVGSIHDLPDEMRKVFSAFRTPLIGWWLVQVQNVFIEQGLPLSVVRTLEERELDAYRQPFTSIAARRPVLVWPRQIPFDGEPADVAERIGSYAAWLPTSTLPKLELHVEPGGITNPAAAAERAASWAHLDRQFLGEGRHFFQEDHGAAIGSAIVDWYQNRWPAAASPVLPSPDTNGADEAP